MQELELAAEGRSYKLREMFWNGEQEKYVTTLEEWVSKLPGKQTYGCMDGRMHAP